ncbi:MAG: molybdate ABC transporter substrate-binding protein [Desulfarculus sp.]|nr:molybdate ABC transporter substrate-binding protein [Pseudomonadota bacterium]MBV1717931.1 molybdate ABC transporter substrate-binding protein [Desulfarculus sp.]MBU4575888.1 molybdate ABC transporter substrate-binding protein [Pseudomonadota bacterium]MBU4598081.1 molybdate ABC transporter substrate-binding protein [Pseudomonadota bacterium]MBV1739455.1 molybdate ABC transporter substrate-binding protein [Desulfarculus sp.]
MPIKKYLRFLAALALACCLGLVSSVSLAAGPVMIFAAASTTNAVSEVIKAYQAAGKGKAVASFASSSTLAKQIARGAPAQIYLSANVKWMNYLAEKKLLAPGTRVDLLGNRLVLIAPKGAKERGPIQAGMPLLAWLGEGRLAVGDPDHVPAGIYAKQALKSLGLWEKAEPRLARAANVRAALALVERGEAPLGIVYATDAAITPKVMVVGVFPEAGHKPIVYPLALLKGQATPSAKAFWQFLQGDEAKGIFKKYGFSVR